MSLSIFVSYSTLDLEHVGTLQRELSDTPIKVYVAESSLPPGSEITSAVRNSIQLADAFVLVWSANARLSEWVLQEVGQAVLLKKPILPIVLDADMKLPDSITNLKFISFAKDPSGAMRQARDFLYANYQARSAKLAAEARSKEESENFVKLLLGGVAFWLFTKK